MCSLIEFMDVVKLAQVELFYLYTNPYFSFEELVFNAFNSLINHSSEQLPLAWWSNYAHPQIGSWLGGQTFDVHIWFDDGFYHAIHQVNAITMAIKV